MCGRIVPPTVTPAKAGVQSIKLSPEEPAPVKTEGDSLYQGTPWYSFNLRNL